MFAYIYDVYILQVKSIVKIKKYLDCCPCLADAYLDDLNCN